MTPSSTVLHFTGYSRDAGGVHAAIRGVSPRNGLRNLMVVSSGFTKSVADSPKVLRLQGLPGWNPENLYNPLTWLICLRLAFVFRGLLRRNPQRLFHGHSRAGMILALLLDFLGQHRVFVSIHANARWRWLVRFVARRLGDRLLFLCPSMKKHYGTDDSDWSRCIPSVSPAMEGLSPSATIAPPRIEGGKPLILGGIGTLIPRKGWHTLVEALSHLPEEFRRFVRFEHCGDTLPTAASKAYGVGLRKQATDLGMDSLITWHGVIADISLFFDRIDVLVLPSENEPFSLVMMEALFAGRPVLASASGGPVDVIQEGVNGWLFASGDARSLASKLGSIIQSAKGAHEVPPPMSCHYLSAFTPDAVGRRWAAHYASFLRR